MHAPMFVFSAHNPYPPQSGAQQRILEVLVALRALGIPVHLTGWADFSENPLTDANNAGMKREGLCRAVSVYKDAAPSSNLAMRAARRLRRVFRSGTRAGDTAGPQIDLTTPGLRRWFHELIRESASDDVMIHYVYFSGIVSAGSPGRRPRTIQESQDLVTLNAAMRRKLQPFVAPGPVFSANSVAEEALDLSFFNSADVAAHPSEFDLIDAYDITLAIAEDEATAMRRQSPCTRVYTLPTPVLARSPAGDHGKLALFPIGPNPFNLQGYAWFVRKVLPLIVKACPDFELGVSGIPVRNVTFEYHARVRFLGFVPDLNTLWSLGRMLVNPVFGGTGQPIKTLEAMAAGVAPVILGRHAKAAPIDHGVSGFVAHDEHEFAECCIRLWCDAALCREMGKRALEAVKTECSRDKFAAGLHAALYTR